MHENSTANPTICNVLLFTVLSGIFSYFTTTSFQVPESPVFLLRYIIMFPAKTKYFSKTCKSRTKIHIFLQLKEMHYQVGHWFIAHLSMVSCIQKPVLFSNFPCTTLSIFFCFVVSFCNAWLTDVGLVQHTVSCFSTGVLQYVYIYIYIYFLQRENFFHILRVQ